MTEELQKVDLDAVLETMGCDARLETCLTERDLLRELAAEEYIMSRQGLGVWRVFGVSVAEWGGLVLGRPFGDENAGLSIWYKSSQSMTAPVVARMIVELSGDRGAKFIDPETGDFLEPDFQIEPRANPLTESFLVRPIPVFEDNWHAAVASALGSQIVEKLD